MTTCENNLLILHNVVQHNLSYWSTCPELLLVKPVPSKVSQRNSLGLVAHSLYMWDALHVDSPTSLNGS